MKRFLILTSTLIGNVAHAEPITLYQASQCANGKCGQVVQAGREVVQYAGNVTQAVVKPFAERKPVRTFLANVRAKLTGNRCR